MRTECRQEKDLRVETDLWGTPHKGLHGQCVHFDFYSERNREPMEGFDKRSYTLWPIFTDVPLIMDIPLLRITW